MHVRLTGVIKVAAILAVAIPAWPLEVCPQGKNICSTSLVTCGLDIQVLVSGTRDVDAFGFDFVYDNTKIQYHSLLPGRRIRNWNTLQASAWNLQPFGTIVRIGGFDPVPFALDGTDTLMTLRFCTTRSVDSTTYSVVNLVDDFAAAETCVGRATYARPGAEPGRVGVYADPAGTICNFDVGPGSVMYVVAHLEGIATVGIEGAEFRVEFTPLGSPAQVPVLTWQPSAAVSTAIGNPIDTGEFDAGVSLTFDTCQQQESVVLGTLTFVDVDSAPLDIFVRRHRLPSDPDRRCVRFDTCALYACSAQCLTPPLSDDPWLFLGHLNSFPGPLCGEVAIQSTTWTRAKKLFRN